MRIESITIENFKVFKETTVKDLSKMAVLLGTNGSGKSSFFDVFGFLSDALQNNVTIALNRRGGFPEVISRGANINKDHIKFEIKFFVSLLKINFPRLKFSKFITFLSRTKYFFE